MSRSRLTPALALAVMAMLFGTASAQIALTGVIHMDGGYQHECAVRDTGDVDCWGLNADGELGDGTLIDRTLPRCVAVEGGIAIIFGTVIPKKASNPEGAKFYCNALLDPEGLAGLVQKSFYSPANSKTVLPEAAAKKISLSADQQKSLHNRPHDFWLKNRNELLEWWNKEFKA
jgi:hypothetical protein